jgi:hypothetical protein
MGRIMIGNSIAFHICIYTAVNRHSSDNKLGGISQPAKIVPCPYFILFDCTTIIEDNCGTYITIITKQNFRKIKDGNTNLYVNRKIRNKQLAKFRKRTLN